MPMLEHDNAIEEYYNEVKDKYPDIPFEKFKLICRTPWLYIKRCIQSTEMPIIHIKFFGKFRVFSHRVIKSLKACGTSYKNNRITIEEYEARKKFLTGYLKQLEDDKNIAPFSEVEVIED